MNERDLPRHPRRVRPPAPPTIKAVQVADAYRAARKRAAETPDPLLARAMGAGAQDFMLQLMKLVGSGSPAIEPLLDAIASDASLERSRQVDKARNLGLHYTHGPEAFAQRLRGLNDGEG